jgi:hypothetical protein
MTHQIRNIEDSLDRNKAGGKAALRSWYRDHPRLVGNLLMMLVFAVICLWVAYVASSTNSEGAIIESILPETVGRESRIDRAMKDLSP